MSTTQPPNLRRSNRACLPNSHLNYRRQIIRENFCQTALRLAKKKLNGKISVVKSKISTKLQKNKEQQHQSRQKNQTKQLNGNGGSDGRSDGSDIVKTLPASSIFDDFTTTDTDIPKSFVVTKDAGISSSVQDYIHPTYYPSEEENSGVIVFKTNSPRLKLNISFAKCFVILNGKFRINLTCQNKDEFQNGDFIKAPAGSKLGIKYLGDGDDYGKIIFFRSVS